MTDYILIDGDIASFMPAFSPAIVVVQPGDITASGKTTLGGKKVCIEGDESSVSVPGCMYIAGGFCIPGTGTLTIASLAGDQVAEKTTDSDTAVMLKGSTFTAEFEVQSPAQQPAPPAPPIPDPPPTYTGSGMFITTNTKWKEHDIRN